MYKPDAAVPTSRTRVSLYETLWPVVFERHTRPLEFSRGHRACARGIGHMEPDCHDAFLDACEAVVEFAMRNGSRVPTDDLARWITPRIKHIVIDGHRRRRGERGALTRPRLPRWLADALDGDPWLTRLSINVLNWVGVAATANGEPWPLQAWAAEWAGMCGGAVDENTVAADLDTVLAAMRTRPGWYDKYVEKPLGYKVAPVAAHPEAGVPLVTDPVGDAVLLSLAEAAIDALTRKLEQGEDPSVAVAEVLAVCFAPAAVLDDSPETERYAERVRALLSSDAFARVVDNVLDIIDRSHD